MARLYVWGDSIAKGLIYDETRQEYVLLEDCALQRATTALELETTSYARAGMTSEQGRLIFDRKVGACRPGDYALAFFGGNDTDYHWARIAEQPQIDHQPRVTLERYRENIRYMISGMLEHKLRPIMITPPEIDSHRYFRWFTRGIEHGENIVRWLGGVERIGRQYAGYVQSLRQIAADFKIPLIDVRARQSELRDQPDLLCIDGIHPNAAGHRQLADIIIEFVRKKRLSAAPL